MRLTARLTTTAKATALKLLVELGEFCSIYQDWTRRNLKCTVVVPDHVWTVEELLDVMRPARLLQSN